MSCNRRAQRSYSINIRPSYIYVLKVHFKRIEYIYIPCRTRAYSILSLYNLIIYLIYTKLFILHGYESNVAFSPFSRIRCAHIQTLCGASFRRKLHTRSLFPLNIDTHSIVAAKLQCTQEKQINTSKRDDDRFI